MFRTAKSGEFTFKRDSAGRETVEHGGLIFATMNGHRWVEYIDPLRIDHPTSESMAGAVLVAKLDGFWTMGTPAHTQSPAAAVHA